MIWKEWISSPVRQRARCLEILFSRAKVKATKSRRPGNERFKVCCGRLFR
jgi:hypothetical protein